MCTAAEILANTTNVPRCGAVAAPTAAGTNFPSRNKRRICLHDGISNVRSQYRARVTYIREDIGRSEQRRILNSHNELDNNIRGRETVVRACEGRQRLKRFKPLAKVGSSADDPMRAAVSRPKTMRVRERNCSRESGRPENQCRQRVGRLRYGAATI
jgi:hypothetical protein